MIDAGSASRSSLRAARCSLLAIQDSTIQGLVIQRFND
jgi:hypothetical protein